MIRTRRLAAVLCVGAAAATMSTAAPALADSTPPPAPTTLYCPTDLQNGQDIIEADGSVLFCVEALGAGAVVARTGVFLEQVIVAPGWAWENASGGGPATARTPSAARWTSSSPSPRPATRSRCASSPARPRS